MDLPDDLTLPLSSGAAWWYWLGGRPAFDFVNTLRERWWRNVETLVTTEDLVTWLRQASLIPGLATATDSHLQSARRLRSAIDAGILAATQGTLPPQAQVVAINGWLARVQPHERLVTDNGVITLTPEMPEDPVDHALHLIAQDAAAVLGTPARARARICASDSCSARFYDASRAGTRRWCSMNSCGNKAKARRHRARVAVGDRRDHEADGADTGRLS